MPVPKFDPTRLQSTKQQPTQDGFDRWDAAAAATRVGGGFASSMGHVPGAVIGGAAEGVAQLLEYLGGDNSLSVGDRLGRIGSEAALSAIPGAMLFKGGRAATSAVRGGAVAGVGEAARQTFSDQKEYDLGRIGGVTAFGGLLGGGLAKVLPGSIGPQDLPPTVAPPRNLAQEGEEIFSKAAKAKQSPRDKNLTEQLDTALYAGKANDNAAVNELRKILEGKINLPSGASGLKDIDASIANEAKNAASKRKFNAQYDSKATKLEQAADLADYKSTQSAASKLDDALLKGEANDIAAAQEAKIAQDLADERAALGYVAEPPSFTEKIAGEIPGGASSKTTRFSIPDEEGEEGVDLLDALLGGGPKGSRAPRAAGAVDDVADDAAGQENELQREIYDAWIRLGETDKMAVKRAMRFEAPVLTETGYKARYVGTPTQVAARKGPSTIPLNPENNELAELLGVAPKVADDVPLPVVPQALPPVAPKAPVDREQLENVTHPSYFDEGFDGLEDAAVKAPKPVYSEAPIGPKAPAQEGWPPVDSEVMDLNRELQRLLGMGDDVAPKPQAPAPMGQPAIQQAKDTFPDEVNAELDQIGPAYRAAKKGSPERAKLGQQMAALRDFMFGRGRFAQGQGELPRTLDEATSPRIPQGPKVSEVVDEAPPAPQATAAPKIEPNADEISAAAKAGRPVGEAADDAQLEEFRKAGITLGSGLGGAQDMLRIVQENPEFALRALLGVGGAVGGAAYDDENRFRGALIGGAAGVGAPSIAKGLKNVNMDSFKSGAETVYNTIPQVQRFNYLADPISYSPETGVSSGLAANAFAGPYGATLMKGIELALSGDPAGLKILKEINPISFGKDMWKNRFEAHRLIKEGNLGRMEGQANTAPQAVQDVLSVPAMAMTAGDVTARTRLTDAGLPEGVARESTLTSEPVFPLMRRIANLTKGSPFGQMLAPFTRTPANIAEQGALRTPGLGFVLQKWGEQYGREADPLKQQVIQQLMSLGLGYGGYKVGEEFPESKLARQLTTNLGGTYSAPVSFGMALGQAKGKGRDVLKSAVSEPVVDRLVGPIPTTQPIIENASALLRLLGIEGFENARIPRGAIPAPIADAFGINAKQNKLESLRSKLPTLQSLRGQ